jgi:hypothetical protein
MKCDPSRGDGAKAGTKAVHVVVDVEGVRDREDPEDGHAVAEDEARDEQCDSDPRQRHRQRDEELSRELDPWPQLAAIVPATQYEHPHRTEEQGRELDGASSQSVRQL